MKKEITVFKDCEELKWYYHRKMCEEPSNQIWFIYMERCAEFKSAKEANSWLKNTNQPYKVKEY